MMFIVEDNYSSQDTLKELMWIPLVQQFMIISSYELTEVSTKNDAITSKYLIAIFTLSQSNI